MPAEFAKLNETQIHGLSKEKSVFFFSVGPIEDHGPYLPIGLDLSAAHQLGFSIAEKMESELPGWQGLLMPPAPLGVDSNTQKIALTVRPHVLRDWLVDWCLSLHNLGFKNFVCISGNLGPRQLTAIEDASKIVRRKRWYRPPSQRPALVSASSALTQPSDLKRSLLFPNPPEHGGEKDISLALFMNLIRSTPELSGAAAQAAPRSIIQRGIQRLRGTVIGYWGDPAKGTSTEGQKILLDQMDTLFPKLKAVWQGSNPHALFRSWYSTLFWNKSFFKAWLLALVTLIIFGLWYWLNFSSIGG